ncbi:MAG: WD40 repeat domain-containing protein [Candidatus Omnitrophota bacterium]
MRKIITIFIIFFFLATNVSYGLPQQNVSESALRAQSLAVTKDNEVIDGIKINSLGYKAVIDEFGIGTILNSHGNVIVKSEDGNPCRAIELSPDGNYAAIIDFYWNAALWKLAEREVTSPPWDTMAIFYSKEDVKLLKSGIDAANGFKFNSDKTIQATDLDGKELTLRLVAGDRLEFVKLKTNVHNYKINEGNIRLLALKYFDIDKDKDIKITINKDNAAVIAKDAMTDKQFLYLLTLNGSTVALARKAEWGDASHFSLSPDLKYIVKKDRFFRLKVIDAQTGEVIIKDNTKGIAWHIEYSPDNKFILLMNRHSEITICNLETGKRIIKNQDAQGGFKFSDNSAEIYVTGVDGVEKTFLLVPEKEILVPDDNITAKICFAQKLGINASDISYYEKGPNKFSIVTTFFGLTSIFNPNDEIVLKNKNAFGGVKFSPDCKYIALRDNHGTASLYDVSNPSAPIEDLINAAGGFEFGPTSKRCYFTDKKGVKRAYDLINKRWVEFKKADKAAKIPKITIEDIPDYALEYLGITRDYIGKIVTSKAGHIAILPKNNILANSYAYILDSEYGLLIKTEYDFCHDLVFSEDAQFAVKSMGPFPLLYVYDLENPSNKHIAELKTHDQWALTSANYLITTDYHNQLFANNLASRRPKKHILKNIDATNGFFTTFDSKFLSIINLNNQLIVRNLETGEVAQTFDLISDYKISPDRRFLAFKSYTNMIPQVTLLDMKNAGLPKMFRGIFGNVTSFEFSEDGKFFYMEKSFVHERVVFNIAGEKSREVKLEDSPFAQKKQIGPFYANGNQPKSGNPIVTDFDDAALKAPDIKYVDSIGACA